MIGKLEDFKIEKLWQNMIGLKIYPCGNTL